jgi:histidinol phosphatase-like enzyme (inositol monophosphatase family)
MHAADLRAHLDFALEAAYEAGRLTLASFGIGIAAERKGDQSPVTAADRAAEQLLRLKIAQHFPEYGIVGEEYGQQAGTQPYTWIVDPIDGTKSFISGVPLYANLIALWDVQADRALVGVANFPALGEVVYAADTLGCAFDGRPARVSRTAALADAVLLFSDVRGYAPGPRAGYDALVNATYIQRTWGDAYGYALVATGRADCMVDPWMGWWDYAPLTVILREAGGTLTEWDGGPLRHGGGAIATNGVLQADVMRVVTQAAGTHPLRITLS